MLNISEPAREMLSSLLREAQAPAGFVPRLVPSEEGLRLRIGEVKPDDKTFDHEGKPVLAVADGIATALDNKSLQVIETPSGPELQLTNAPKSN